MHNKSNMASHAFVMDVKDETFSKLNDQWLSSVQQLALTTQWTHNALCTVGVVGLS